MYKYMNFLLTLQHRPSGPSGHWMATEYLMYRQLRLSFPECGVRYFCQCWRQFDGFYRFTPENITAHFRDRDSLAFVIDIVGHDDVLACGRLLCGRLAGGRLAAGRLVLDRLGRLYDLFADFVFDALEAVLKLLGISAWHAHEKCRADD